MYSFRNLETNGKFAVGQHVPNIVFGETEALESLTDKELAEIYRQCVLSDTTGADNVDTILKVNKQIMRFRPDLSPGAQGPQLEYTYSLFYQEMARRWFNSMGID